MTALALLAAALLVAPFAFNAAAYAGRWRLQRRQSCREDPLPIAAATVAFLAEYIALTITVLTWPLSWPAPPPPAGSHRALVLVPGFGMSRSALWLLQRRLRRSGWYAHIFSWRRYGLDLERASAGLDAYLHAIPAAAPLTVLAIGLGGLVARLSARDTTRMNLRSLITLGTPHEGTLAPMFVFGPLRCVRPDSPLMQHLRTDDRVTERCDVVAISSDFDAVVTPLALADYAGAFNIEVRGIGHFQLLYARRAWELIHENLNAIVARGEHRS